MINEEKEAIEKYYDDINEHNRKVRGLQTLIYMKYGCINGLNDPLHKDISKHNLDMVYKALSDFDKKYDGWFCLTELKPIF